MKVSQLSVFIENQSGRLADVTRVLADNAINIRALSVADKVDYGLLRLIVDDPEKAKAALTEEGFTVAVTNVLAIEVPDVPGGLAGIISILADAGANIEYMYAFVGTSGKNAIVIFRIENADDAIEILQSRGIKILSGAEVYAL
jgi:hypothetical protein